ncbi:hypothetical protein WG8_4706 [Paenibacillus sp. Aloe-11]|nr:hypothetical protein WG8_4706 [Paenibacillus sp. Aloe-11]
MRRLFWKLTTILLEGTSEPIVIPVIGEAPGTRMSLTPTLLCSSSEPAGILSDSTGITAILPVLVNVSV